MSTEELNGRDRELIELAKQTMAARHVAFWHVVSCAVRSVNGRAYSGVHLEGSIGRTAVCAEAVAIGRMVTEGDGPIETIAAVQMTEAGPGKGTIVLVAPCGICREMIWDYSRNARVIIPDARGEPIKVPVYALLPLRYNAAGAPSHPWPCVCELSANER